MAIKLEAVLTLLRQIMGLDIDVMGRQTMRALIEGQMKVEGVTDGRTYAGLIASSPGHLERLIDAVVVTESWFFREPDALRRVVELAAKPRSHTFRVLCLPCAGGEEAYSLAISLMEAGLDDFTITACDISGQALNKAREAVYGKYAFRGRRPDGMTAYFQPLGRGRFQVQPAVRGRVRFRQANVMEGLQELDGTFDAILCRHLLIYLTPEARKAALDLFAAKLTSEGELLVAACEMPTLLLPERSDESSTVAIVKARPTSPPLFDPLPPSPILTSPPSPFPEPEPRTPETDAPASLPPPSAAEAELALARQQADEGNLQEAANHCEESLRRQPTSGAYLLMGAIKAALGEHDQAQIMVRRAVYLDPRDVDALRHLAVYAERDGRGDVAQGLRYRAARAEREKARQSSETRWERSS